MKGQYDRNGKNNPRWKGGTSEGYQIKIYRGILKEHGVDLSICENCGLHESEVKRIEIHHKDRDHFNNKLTNLSVLCSRCHNLLHKTKKKVKLICLNCNNNFEVIPSKKNRKFCSKKCSNSYYNNLRKGTGFKAKMICLFCKKEFEINCFSKNNKFCSQRCHYDNNKINGKKWSKQMLQKRYIKINKR